MAGSKLRIVPLAGNGAPFVVDNDGPGPDWDLKLELGVVIVGPYPNGHVDYWPLSSIRKISRIP